MLSSKLQPLMILLATLLAPQLHAQTAPEADFVPGEVIIKFKEGADLGAETMAMALGAGPVRTSGGELVFDISSTAGFEAMDTKSKIEQTLSVVEDLKKDENVEYAQPNWILRHMDTPSTSVPNDPRYTEQWHYQNRGTNSAESAGGINLPKAWANGVGSGRVIVAVIDTGILPEHEDIKDSGNLIDGYDMISSIFTSNDGDGRDADPTDTGDAVAKNECGLLKPARDNSWHGTHVAGTIGAVGTDNGKGISGINWAVKVMPLRVLGKCGGSTVDINDAIRWAAGLPVPDPGNPGMNIPINPNKAHIINLSLGGFQSCKDSPSSQEAINDVVAEGVTVVVAAGNNSMDAAKFNPASCDNVITVAASDARGHLATRYSNFGKVVEIMAPGGDVARDDNNDSVPDGVLSAVKGGYKLSNGTSMAAPHTAGVAALLIAQDNELEWKPDEIWKRLKEFAVARDGTHCPKSCGAGLLSAVKE